MGRRRRTDALAGTAECVGRSRIEKGRSEMGGFLWGKNKGHNLKRRGLGEAMRMSHETSF